MESKEVSDKIVFLVVKIDTLARKLQANIQSSFLISIEMNKRMSEYRRKSRKSVRNLSEED